MNNSNLSKNDLLIEELLKDSKYKVTSDGRILSKAKGWTEITAKNVAGYIRLKYNGTFLLAHRIVYRALIGPLDSSKVINHKNGSKSDNNPINLEQVTQAQNNKHKYSDLGHFPVVGYKKINLDIAEEIRRKVALENHRACDLAKEYKVSNATISLILNGKIWKPRVS